MTWQFHFGLSDRLLHRTNLLLSQRLFPFLQCCCFDFLQPLNLLQQLLRLSRLGFLTSTLRF